MLLLIIFFTAKFIYGVNSWRVSQCNDELGNVIDCIFPKNQICYKKQYCGKKYRNTDLGYKNWIDYGIYSTKSI